MFFALAALAFSAVRPQIEERREKKLAIGDSSQSCIFCKFYASLIEDYLEEGQTQEEIVQALESLCSYVAESVQEVCKVAVETLIPTVIELIKKELPPHEICILVKLCKD